MKRNILIITMACLSIWAMTSCDVLDIKPMNIITDEDIFVSESGIDAYFASLYNWNSLPIEDFRYHANSDAGSFPGCDNFNERFPEGRALAILSGETAHQRGYVAMPTGTQNPWWGYKPVRNVNYFLQTLPSYKNNFSKEKYETWMGEAYFIRAFMYFAMVKRYGGVPIIKDPQVFTGSNLEELQVSRNTERECYDFILNDLDEAVSLLPESRSVGGIQARIDKWVAWAFRSRVALYAGSIAKYGMMKNEELQGIPASYANNYFKMSYDAAMQVKASQKFSLYRAKEDKADNFYRLFQDKTAANTERIFWREYKYPEKTHEWDLLVMPYEVRASAGYGGRSTPTLEMVELFEYVNNPDGTLKVDKTYDHPLELFAGKDPRCRGSIIFPYDTWRGDTIHIRRGVIANGVKYPGSGYNSRQTIPGYGDIIVNEGSGIGGNEQTWTGFYIRKFTCDSYDRTYLGYEKSDEQWIAIRYAEVLLNLAEAALEMGTPDKATAKEVMNDIRDRAGISLLSDADVTIERVRHEREVELAFENHRYWDMRRWRNGDTWFHNSYMHALYPWYNLDTGKWEFTISNMDNAVAYVFEEKTYYERIPSGEINTNPNMKQNDPY